MNITSRRCLQMSLFQWGTWYEIAFLGKRRQEKQKDPKLQEEGPNHEVTTEGGNPKRNQKTIKRTASPRQNNNGLVRCFFFIVFFFFFFFFFFVLFLLLSVFVVLLLIIIILLVCLASSVTSCLSCVPSSSFLPLLPVCLPFWVAFAFWKTIYYYYDDDYDYESYGYDH